MGLETGTYISDLNASNPVGASDPKSQGDDHIRLIKATILATFPSITGAITLSHTEINDLPQKPNANTFTNTGTRRNAPIVIEGANPNFAMYETDAGVNEKGWDWLADGGALALRTHTDAGAAGTEPLTFVRSGTAITDIQCRATSVELLSGTDLQIYDSTNADYIQWDVDGTDANLRTVGITDVNFDVAQGMTGQFKFFRDSHFVSGSVVQIRSTDNNDNITISCDNTRAKLESTEHIQLVHAASHYVYVYNSAGTVDGDFRVYARDGSDVLRHTSQIGTAFSIATHDYRIQVAGGENAIVCTQNSGVDFYHNNVNKARIVNQSTAGEVSGMKIANAAGVLKPAGLGVLENDATAWGSGTLTPFQQVNAGEVIYHDNSSGTNYDTYASTGSDQTNIPDGAWWLVQMNAGSTLTIRGGTGVTIRYWAGEGAAPADVDVTVARGGYALVRKVSDTVYDVMGKGLS